MSTTAQPTRPPVKPKVTVPDCKIETMPSGEGIARIVIPAEVMRRLKTRAGQRGIDDYAWVDIIRPALYANTF